MRKMKDEFRQLPAALQKQILIRGVLGTVALLIFIAILICTKELSFGIPCIVLSLFMIVNSIQLLYNCIKGSYVVIEGVCEEVEKTAIRKWVKSLSMIVEDKRLMVSVRRRFKAPAAGDQITVYLPVDTPVYESEGGYCVYSYYALEIHRKV